jgi:hypothetical protein
MQNGNKGNQDDQKRVDFIHKKECREGTGLWRKVK